jgi:hypothetical protein
VNSGQSKVVVLGAQGALDVAAVERGCADADLVVSMVNGPSHTAERFVLDRRPRSRGRLRLSEVRGGFEEQDIRIEAMAKR